MLCCASDKRVMCDIETHGSLQMDNVSRWVTEACNLIFYSVGESLLILIQQNSAHAGMLVVLSGARACVWVLSPMP